MSFIAKFLGWLAAPLLFVWLATVALGLLMIARTVDQPFDQRLEDVARGLGHGLAATDDAAAPLTLTPGAAGLLHVDRRDQVYFAVRSPAGAVITGDADVPPVPGTIGATGAAFHTGLIDGEPVRVASVTVPDPGRDGATLVVQVAETMNKRRELMRDLQAQALVPQFFVLLGAFVLVWYGLAYVIAPMRALKAQMDRRDAADLTPIDPLAAPQELSPLFAAINGLMARLAVNVEMQRRFIADAAHQLRTPLAGLKSQTELALWARDPATQHEALTRLEAGATRVSHLANRLLTLARAGTRQGPAHVPVDLAAVARAVVEDALPRAIDRGIDLGLDAPVDGAPATIVGDPLLVRELVGNLVDNALQYTPRGGAVTVVVDATPAVAVVDTGPGIPAAERERVLQPFYRGADAAVPGTGLGLAIVDEIARAHHARVTIGEGADGRGARIAVAFPAPPAP
jgi:two-component system sensor histidine kinase TctE